MDSFIPWIGGKKLLRNTITNMFPDQQPNTYVEVFGESDHIKLRDALCNMQGKVVVSYNDDDFIRDLYKDFNLRQISRSSNIANRNPKANHKFKELIITNY